ASGEVRGGDSVKLHADQVIYVEAEHSGNDSPIEIRRGKARSGAPMPDLTVRLVDRADQSTAVERVTTKRSDASDRAPADKDAARRDQVLELLPLAPEELYNAMRDDYGCGRTVTKRVRDKLEAEGLIAQRDGLWRRVGE